MVRESAPHAAGPGSNPSAGATRIVDEWNALSADTVSATSLETFKHLLRRDLGEKLFEFNR